MTKPIKTLYTASDVAKVRAVLLEEQNGQDALTGLLIEPGKAVLDHCHDSQFVRAVLDRQTNAVLGKIENLENRYLSWWFPYDLPTFLRLAADYLEAEHKQEYKHPGWIKKVKTEFNKLNSNQQAKVLISLNNSSGANGTQRKKLFSKAILTKEYDHDTIISIINQSKETNET